MNGINFGGYSFSEPAILPSASTVVDTILGQPGLYAILVYDPSCTPRPYRVLYFGESENIQTRATSNHENYSHWRTQAGPLARIYRSVHPLSSSTKLQRQQVESALIAKYKPKCNERLSFDFALLFSAK
jgi:excinuclease UvrABC nuclease subunit